MSKGVSDKITYKPYSQDERWLLPPRLEELVPENHLVRTVSRTVDELNIEKIFSKNTKYGGASRYKRHGCRIEKSRHIRDFCKRSVCKSR